MRIKFIIPFPFDEEGIANRAAQLPAELRTPGGPGIRLDDGVYEGWTVPNDYDPLLAKLIAWGNSREETIARLRRALEESTITGIKTNVALFRRLLTEPDFLKAEIHTKWLDELLSRSNKNTAEAGSGSLEAAAIAAAIWQASRSVSSNGSQASGMDTASRWKQSARRDQLDRTP